MAFMNFDNLSSYKFNPIQDGLFRGCSRMGEAFLVPFPQNPPHKSYNDETWHSYTLPREVPKTA